MNVDEVNKMLTDKHNLAKTIGLEFVNTLDYDQCVAKLKVTPRLTEPFGYMNSGISVALAENVADVASHLLCPDHFVMGVSMTSSQYSAVNAGDTITATATLEDRKETMLVWNVDIRDGAGRLFFSSKVTNFLLEK